MKFLAPWLALAALGVQPLHIPEPRFAEVPAITTGRRTGVAAMRREARKNRNRKKAR